MRSFFRCNFKIEEKDPHAQNFPETRPYYDNIKKNSKLNACSYLSACH